MDKITIFRSVESKLEKKNVGSHLKFQSCPPPSPLAHARVCVYVCSIYVLKCGGYLNNISLRWIDKTYKTSCWLKKYERKPWHSQTFLMSQEIMSRVLHVFSRHVLQIYFFPVFFDLWQRRIQKLKENLENKKKKKVFFPLGKKGTVESRIGCKYCWL